MTPHPTTTRQGYPCCDGYGEHFADCPLVATICDRHGHRYLSPLGERRQRAVPCQLCGADTWALDVRCDRCATASATRAITHLGGDAIKALTVQ